MYITIAVKHIHFDSYFVINQPAKGNDISDPIGKPNKMVPNSESVKCNFSLKSGILVAQLAKFIQQRKNSKLIDALFLNIKLIIIKDWLLHPKYRHVGIHVYVSYVVQ